MGKKALAAVAVLAIVAVASFAVYELYAPGGSPGCGAIPGGTEAHLQTSETQFGAVTEYKIPGADRYPNAIVNGSDGSVWFAEDELPGLGHLFPGNGTVVEYAWPNYPTPQPPDCLFSAGVTGIAIWQGRVWGADEYNNAIIGVNPSGGSTLWVNTTSKADFPYWLAVGPDGDLWFTSDNTPGRLGRIEQNMSVQVFNLAGIGSDEPLTLQFVNSSLAFFSTVDLSNYGSSAACICSGHIYSFDPSDLSATISPRVLGPGFNLTLPTDAAFSDGSVWVPQHDGSNVMRFNTATGTWTAYPTSTVPFVSVTLPLQTAAGDGVIWFNEHYANKIAEIDPAAGTLTEYSESNPPASSAEGIQNDVSIAVADGGVWFTSLTGNYVGFVNGSYNPGWRVVPGPVDSVTTAPSVNSTLSMEVAGSWQTPLGVSVSDTENLNSTPSLIRVIPSVSSVPAGGTAPFNLAVSIFVGGAVKPGEYTVAVTLTGGLTQESAYFFVRVE